MHQLHRSSVADGGCGGGRALRRVDSSPRPALCRSDSIKKKRSKRSRLSAALRELRLAAEARDKDGLLRILVTGHRRRRSGSGDGAGGTSTESSVASTDGADQRARLGVGVSHLLGGAGDAAVADGPSEFERPNGGAIAAGRRYPSWALAVALVLVLACVVALGKAPAICCCTCAAWWCGGGSSAEGHTSDSASGARRSSVTSVVQPKAGSTSNITLPRTSRGGRWLNC